MPQDGCQHTGLSGLYKEDDPYSDDEQWAFGEHLTQTVVHRAHATSSSLVQRPLKAWIPSAFYFSIMIVSSEWSIDSRLEKKWSHERRSWAN